MDWLADHAALVGLVLFFTIFLIVVGWAFFPGNKKKFERYGKIPLKENRDEP